MREVATLSKNRNPKALNKEQLLNDYRIAQESRQASLMGRKEVFMGKAKFGIFGDGKELARWPGRAACTPAPVRRGSAPVPPWRLSWVP